MCEESARMDDKCKCGVSVYVAGNEFFADQYLARVTGTMDKKSPSWESELEVAEISVKTVREFLAKSDREFVWNGQQNRNAELKSAKINQIWIY